MESPFGIFSMTPADQFEAGSYTTITFKIKVGSKGIKRGGSIKISAPNMGWGEPLCLKTREWEELLEDTERKHNPWKAINTTCTVRTKGNAAWSSPIWISPENCNTPTNNGFCQK